MELSNNSLFHNGCNQVGDPPLGVKSYMIICKKTLKISWKTIIPLQTLLVKELNSLLNKAKKEISSINFSESHEIKENKEFDDLITNWSETSQKILLILSNKEQVLTKNRTPKFLMALGAMGAHISMALQALKATESDQWKLNINLLHNNLK